MVEYWVLSCSHFTPSPQVITSISTSSHTIYVPSVASLMYSLQSSKSISIEMSKSAHLPLCPIFIYDISLDPAAHVTGSELIFSSPLFSHLIIYQILCVILDLSVLSIALIPTGSTYKLPSFLDKATYWKSFLTCFYMSTLASWDPILLFLTNLKIVCRSCSFQCKLSIISDYT